MFQATFGKLYILLNCHQEVFFIHTMQYITVKLPNGTCSLHLNIIQIKAACFDCNMSDVRIKHNV